MPKINAQGQSPIDLSAFRGKTCRVLEFNHDSKCALLIDPDATGLGGFDFSELLGWFECRDFSGLLIPNGLSWIQEIEYFERVFSYEQNQKRDMGFIRKMVIVQSLSKGKFIDTLYFHFSSMKE